jgi:hypothetical protein
MLKHAENPFQRAFNVTQQLYILVLYCAEMFLADFKMAAVFLAKLQRRDHSPKQDESTHVLFDPPLFSLDSPFNCLLSPHVLTNIIHIAFHSVPAGVSVKANALIFFRKVSHLWKELLLLDTSFSYNLVV